MAGQTFGRYRVGELLGRGGMGEVHRAYDTVHGRDVALKRLSVALAGDEDRARFRRESKTASSLTEPHVVRVYDYGEVDGQPYLAMQLVEGTDLRQLLFDGPLTPAEAVELLAQIASALDAAHDAGVVHRDVKPSNILLQGENAYLADFGIAKLMSPDATALTRTGEIGTLDYMAPERLMVRGADGRSDVYALACVLFQCLTGKLPFPAEDSAGKLAAQLNDPPPTVSLFDPRIPAAFDLVVATGMDKDPARRYQRAGDLMAAAAGALAPSPLPTETMPTSPNVADDPGTGHIMRAIVSVAAGRPTRRPAHDDDCPYPGLRSFGPGDAAAFYGREHAVTDVLVRLSRQTPDSGPLMVVGASGAGKSSLLHAGVLPALHAGSEGSWPQVTVTPGPTPLTTLAARLAPLARMDAGDLARRLHARPTELGNLCRQIARQRGGEHGRLVLVVDQLEELFTTGDGSQNEAFATAIAHASPALVILAVRADFVEQCLRLAPLRPALANPYLVGPLGLPDLHRVIAEPARVAGLTVENGLADRLVADLGARDRSGYDPGTLPRLAHALRETWRHREGHTLTLRAYQATGGIDRAVALTADGVYQRLPDHDKPLLRAALLRMVTVLDGGGLARRKAGRGEVAGQVLNQLVEARLVTAEADGVQLSHDALLTAWPRLREWIDEDRQNLLVRQHLDQAAASWQASGRDAGELYRGARLAGALDWAGGRTDLTETEQHFLRRSQRAQRRTTRRLTALVAGLAVLLVAALVAGVLAVLSADEARREASVAESRRLAAESLADADFDPVGARRKALDAWQASPTAAARGALLSNATYDFPVRYDSGIEDPQSMDVSPDGSLVAVGGAGGEVVVIDTRTGTPLDAEFAGAGGNVLYLEFSPDGSMLAQGSIDVDGVRIWEVPSGELVSELFTNYGTHLAWHPNGDTIAALSYEMDGTAVAEYDPHTGTQGDLLTTRAEDFAPYDLAYNASGSRLAIVSGVGELELWDPAAARLLDRRAAHDVGGVGQNIYVGFAGDTVVSAGAVDTEIRLADADTGEPSGTVADPDRLRLGARFAVAGADIVTPGFGGANGLVRWSVATRRAVGGHPQGPDRGDVRGLTIVNVASSAAGDVVGVQLDGTVLRWPSNPGWFSAPAGAVGDLAVSPDGRHAAAVDGDSQYLWDPTTGRPERVLTGGRPFAVAYGPNGARFVAGADGTATMSRGEDGQRTFDGGWDGAERGEIAVSPDGTLLAVLAEQRPPGEFPIRRIHVWDTRLGQRRAEIDMENAITGGLAFSPDGDQLIVAANPVPEDGSHDTSENLIRRWRTSDFTEQEAIETTTLGDTEFTPDGRSLLLAADSRIEVVDPATGEVRRTIAEHPSVIRSVAVSPDGRTVATTTMSETVVRLWNLADGALVARLDGHTVGLGEVTFSPDGKLLLSGGYDTDVGVWPVDPDAAVARICADLLAAREHGPGC